MAEMLFGGRAFAGFLFDMDGTLILSKDSAERVWSVWARRHGIDPAHLLPTIHGVRTIDTMKALQRPELDVEVEAAWILQAEIDDAEGVSVVPGAADFLASLPRDRWMIVTSAPLALAEARLAAAGLPPPPKLLSAEDVERGKPDPQGYRLAAARLGAEPDACLVFEDAAAGIAAAEAAGSAVVVIDPGGETAASAAHPTLVSFERVAAVVTAAGICLAWS